MFNEYYIDGWDIIITRNNSLSLVAPEFPHLMEIFDYLEDDQEVIVYPNYPHFQCERIEATKI